MKTIKQSIGKIGEDLACEYLKSLNYKITERNHLRKWGEIDIIAKKKEIINFVEVKTVTRSYTCNLDLFMNNYKAEDNLHLYKTERIKKTIQTYLLNIKREMNWQFDVIVVVLSKDDLTLLKLEHMKNVVL